MNPEREVINWWLNRKGFFSINNITASNNREIDLIAVKVKDGKVEKVQNIEMACSITSIDNFKPDEYLKRFEDKSVAEKLKLTLKNFVGAEVNYEKVLIIGQTSRLDDFNKLSGITIINFSDVMLDVMKGLDKWYYKDQVIRTLQLLKYSLLADPDKLATLLEEQDEHKILKLTTRKDFLKNLLSQAETKRALGKEMIEKELIEVLKHSSLNQPEKLARVIEEEILGVRSRKKFLNALLKYEGVKQELKEAVVQNENLSKFIEG